MGVKYAVNEEYFDTWTHRMAYWLGYLYADGSLEDSPSIRGKYVRACSTDYALLESLRTDLDSRHTLVELHRNFQTARNAKRRWLIRIGNERLYQSLVRHGLHPHKSLTIVYPDIPPQYMFDFVRGYFDGDGCVHAETNSRNGLFKRLRCIFTSGSKIFLEQMHQAVCTIEPRLATGQMYTVPRAYKLIYPTDASIDLFQLIYRNASSGVFLARKRDIFVNYLKQRPKKCTPDVQKVIDQMAQW